MTTIPAIPEKNKRPGVCYAVTDDGVELPVVDITNPAFAVEVSREGLPEFAEGARRSMRQWARIPAPLRRFLARGSVLMGRSSGYQRGTFLTGMTTYLYKLGPANLGAGYTGRLDRRMAASLLSVAVRLRLEDVARFIADALGRALAAREGQPVHLLNIGGGPAPDSLNALILLARDHPERLAGREIRIQVLDTDEAGPSFGARALAALRADGAPLRGLNVGFDHVKYDWSDTSTLERFLRQTQAGDPAAIGSSEGGLFEYGSDEVIAANMEVLSAGTSDDFVMVGTLVRDAPISWESKEMADVSFIPRDLGRFANLIGRAGWTLQHTLEYHPVYHIVAMVKG